MPCAVGVGAVRVDEEALPLAHRTRVVEESGYFAGGRRAGESERETERRSQESQGGGREPEGERESERETDRRSQESQRVK